MYTQLTVLLVLLLEQSNSSSNLVSVIKSTPTNSSEISKPHGNLSDIDIIIDVESNMTLDASATLSSSVNRKRSKRCSKSSNKDRCPCLTSDATSWKPKCCNYKQTWHTACCNLQRNLRIGNAPGVMSLFSVTQLNQKLY